MSLVHEPGKPPHLQLPNFEPLPPDKWINRVINNLLKPLFYLLFTLITSIIIIPVYTIFENLSARNQARNGQRNGNRSTYTMNGEPVESRDGKLQNFLHDYGKSYGSGSGGRRRH